MNIHCTQATLKVCHISYLSHDGLCVCVCVGGGVERDTHMQK